MKRLIEKTVFCGLVTAWRLATVPTRRSPELVKATTEGVVRPPSAFSITVGSPPSSTAMHEFVVPRSMPIVFAIALLLLSGYKNLSPSVADLEGGAVVRCGPDVQLQRAPDRRRGRFAGSPTAVPGGRGAVGCRHHLHRAPGRRPGL